MGWLSAGMRRLSGLFIDDGSLALGAVLWVFACWALWRGLGLSAVGHGAALFAGIAIILLLNALRAARRR